MPGLFDFRLPIKIVSGKEERIPLIFAKCDHEEIIKYNCTESTLYFHEKCEKSIEIWIFGSFSQNKSIEIEIKFDYFAALIVTVRDFRSHIFTSAAFLSLLSLARVSSQFYIALLIAFYFVNTKIRDFSFFYWENPHDQHINYNIIDILLIHALGKGLLVILSAIYQLIFKSAKRLTFSPHVSTALLPILYFYPWEVSILITFSSFKHEKTFFVSILSQLSLISLHIGHYYAFFSHSIDDKSYMIVPAVLLIYAQMNFDKVSCKKEAKLAAFLIAICVHDLLYRMVFILQGLCLWMTVKIIFLHLIKKIKSFD